MSVAAAAAAAAAAAGAHELVLMGWPGRRHHQPHMPLCHQQQPYRLR
jgi:hypothetical protein